MLLFLVGLGITAYIVLEAFRLWVKDRWLSSNLRVLRVGDLTLKISWNGKRPIYIYEVRLEVPRGRGLKPRVYDAVRIRRVVRSGEEVEVRLNKSIETYIRSLNYLKKTPYCILETSEGVLYPYLT